MSSDDGVVERGPADVPQGEDGDLRGCPQQEPDVEEEDDAGVVWGSLALLGVVVASGGWFSSPRLVEGVVGLFPLLRVPWFTWSTVPPSRGPR